MFTEYIVRPMINALIFLYAILGAAPETFGLAIIIFTVLVRLITLPLTYRQMKSSLVTQELQQSKRFKKIQEKYKNDRQKLSEEQMKLFQEAGVNPLAGCLPLLIQFPIIIGLYQAIMRTMAASPIQLLNLSELIYTKILNVNPSLLIPLNSKFLWMNIGQPERLTLPFLSGVPLLEVFAEPGNGLPVLAILVALTTWLQTKITTPTTTDSQGAAMTQMMGIYMPLLLGYFAFNFASGLALYFVASNILGIIQGIAIRRLRESAVQKSPKQ